MQFLPFVFAALAWSMLTKNLPAPEVFYYPTAVRWTEFIICLVILMRIQDVLGVKLKLIDDADEHPTLLCGMGLVVGPILYTFNLQSPLLDGHSAEMYGLSLVAGVISLVCTKFVWQPIQIRQQQ